MKEWISLLGHIDPIKTGKLLIVTLLLMFTITTNAQKPVMVNVIVNNQVVQKPATEQQVIGKMTKTSYTYEHSGKQQPVYTTGKSYYAIIPVNGGIAKKRLTIQF